MHSSGRNLTLFVLAVLSLVALLGFALTRPTANVSLPKQSTGTTEPTPAKLVDQSPLKTALSLGNVPSTAEEQNLAAEAVHAADQEVDIAFASALQQAQLHPPVENSTTQELNTRIRFLESRLQSVQEQTSQLTKLAANPGKNDAHAIQQQLEIAQARAALLQDGLDDAKEDLIRAGGDPQAQIKQEMEEHEALQHGSSNVPPSPSSKPVSFSVDGDLVSQAPPSASASGQARG